MDTPWMWGIFVAFIFFVMIEARALLFPEQHDTLSIFIRKIAARYPISIYIMGVFSGGLAIHLFACGCAAP